MVGVMQAMGTALSGLRAAQAGLDVVSQNVSNAGSVGYTRRSVTLEQTVAGDTTTGAQVSSVQRMLDQLLQRQLRIETGGASYTDVTAKYANSLDQLFGTPGGADALDTNLNNFTQALQALQDDPSSSTARTNAAAGAQNLASQINSISNQVQLMRTDAEASIAADVKQANDLLSQLQSVNEKIVADGNSTTNAALFDRRDQIVDGLSRLFDIKVTNLDGNSIGVSTTGGLTLFDGVSPLKLSFDQRTQLGPQSLYNTDPTLRTVGTITATDASGGSFDILSGGYLRSGEIKAYVDIRDKTLVQAQTQLDQLAANLSQAASDTTVQGTPTGATTGFNIDLTGLQKGNVITLDYIDTPAGTAHRVSFVRVDDASQLPLPNTATADTTDTVYGIDFSGGMGSVATQIQTALGAGFSVSNPSGNTLQILDDGASGTTDVTGLKANVTQTTLQSGQTAFPLFVDGGYGNTAFTGSFDGGAKVTGFAQRIAINPAVLSDPSLLVKYTSTTLAGDAARPQALYDALTSAQRTFSPEAGIGSSTSAYTGTVGDFARRVVETQGANSQNAASLNEGQQTVLSSLQSRFAETAGVNVDQEMAHLVQLQTAYAANARVISAAKDMMDALLRI